MTRSACVSPAVSASSPSPAAIVSADTAPASGQPAHPPFLRSSPAVAVALTSDVQVTACPSAALVDGAGCGGAVGVAVAGGAPAPAIGGIFTRYASRRPVPALAVQMKYSPVMSRLPFGSFE